ncbi:Hypothetical protein CINCED_3A004467 [Cinara cedri]|uniref:Uncharacterized protein n=1 Tax=Cinara cedri TaxID=506608 RepID=A0A5E4MHK4_9HEMI|nr:Hypothetical protein CINCED_3A004467 [Cinara cedri]
MSNDHALRYMEYLYKNIEVSEEIINDGTKQIMPLTSILMSPRNYCIILSDQLMSNTLFDSSQWASRILACYDDMVEYGVDLYLLKERTTSILTAFQKLQKNEGNSKKNIYI